MSHLKNTSLKTEFKTIIAADGHEVPIKVVYPVNSPLAVIIVLQEIFGANAHMFAIAQRLAIAGYLSVVPDLYAREKKGLQFNYDDESFKQAITIRDRVGTDGPLKDIVAAVEWAKPFGKVGLLGFCLGGTWAWLTSSSNNDVSAAVSFYGGGLTKNAHLSAHCPVMAHFGRSDPYIAIAEVEKFKLLQPQVAVNIYEASHGFNCDERASYDKHAADCAWKKTLTFFSTHLI